jgi:hypothetical protein|tara:strand:+ start:2800 stop:3084 length:285 start_codon:yes stop_codon:yes gene_type:complete
MEKGHYGQYSGDGKYQFKYSPVTGSDQNLDNSEEGEFNSAMEQQDNYSMSANKMSVLKNRYSAMPQSESQTNTFGPEGTNPNPGVYAGIVENNK